jgi:hypothetical protein
VDLRTSLGIFLGIVLAALLSLGCDAPSMTATVSVREGSESEPAPLPARLSDTFVEGRLSFSPQYPLWTDGAEKRRWIHLPEGTHVDASDPDAFRFPPGTRIWKEFSFGGRRVETRYMEALPSGEWRYASYVWSPDESDAFVAEGAGDTVALADGGRHFIPSDADCRACHEGRPSPVLGFSLLQLSSDRDPLAPHAAAADPNDVDLSDLVDRGLVRGLSARFTARPPRIEARTPVERAARGYLHGNCGGCHNAEGPLASLGLVLWQSADPGASDGAIASAVARPSRFRPEAHPDASSRIEPGDAARSVLALRMRSRDPYVQMPPIGSFVVDDAAAGLVEQWINSMETHR